MSRRFSESITPREKEDYQNYIKKETPQKSLPAQMLKAFIVGGLICVLGQIILNVATNIYGLDDKTAGSICSLILVGISAILTGFGAYAKIVSFGGAGALVPITGFANSICAPAVEYRGEGQVYGIGCKIFSIAGPVILYGIFTGFLVGIIYWLCSLLMA